MAVGQRFVVRLGDRQVTVEVVSEGERAEVRVDDEPLDATLEPPAAGGVRALRIGDRRIELLVQPADDGSRVVLDGVQLELAVEDERKARLARFGGGRATAAGPSVVRAPMPGLVVRVPVEVGQAVEAGQVIVVLQAMKMENELASSSAGTVRRVLAQPGQAVEQGQVLVELE
jgi:pyruvate carboxylase subunit B